MQGLFAGYGGIALTMAAESAPPDRTAYAIGTVQTAQRLGPALGPVIGGAVAQMVGLRNAFLMTSGFYVVALAIVFFLYEERHGPPSRVAAGATAIRFRSVLAFENFILLMAVIFGLQFVDRSYGPILPLYVAQLGTPPQQVPLIAGLIFSVAAGAGAVGNQLCTRLLRWRPARTIMALAAVTGAVRRGAVRSHAHDGRDVPRDAGPRAGAGRRHDHRLHCREQRDPAECARRRIRAAHDGLAGGAGAEPDRLRLHRRDKHPRRVHSRRRHHGSDRRRGLAPHGGQRRRPHRHAAGRGNRKRSDDSCTPRPAAPDPAAIAAAVAVLRSGGVVAYPTDTLYGLAVDPRNDAAVERLFAVKGRDAAVGDCLDRGRRNNGRAGRGQRFRPARAAARVGVLAGTADDRRAGHVRHGGGAGAAGNARRACAGSSRRANVVGGIRRVHHGDERQSRGAAAAVTADEVAATLDELVDFLVDAGPAPGGAPSTIVELVEGRPLLHRAGAVAWDRVLESIE